MSVAARSTGRGIGSAILRRLLAIASSHGDEALTLITYADIPWNQPFYERHGFSAIDPREVPPYLRGLLDDERAVGVDVSRRSPMISRLRRLGSPT
jgi:ribosomal protein S18 acetylase RimI-like enzyme